MSENRETNRFKVYTGVMGSQWADEMPQILTFESEQEFRDLVEGARQRAELAGRAVGTLPPGTVVDVQSAGDGQTTLTVVATDEVGDDWLCEKHPPGEECANCHGGFTYSDDRYVKRCGADSRPYICFDRYYDPVEPEEE